VLAFSTVAATEENQGFLHSFPFLTIAYTSCAVIFGQVVASWNPKRLGRCLFTAVSLEILGGEFG
jgi:membrane-bound metal-dependent hydrolase YbcI (DUF457 family)